MSGLFENDMEEFFKTIPDDDGSETADNKDSKQEIPSLFPSGDKVMSGTVSDADGNDMFVVTHPALMIQPEVDTDAETEDEAEEDTKVIDSFTGKYAFLANSFESEFQTDITWEELDEYDEPELQHGYEYFRSVEHAFQANKTLDREDQEAIKRSPTATTAKRIGKRVSLVDGWDGKKLAVMERLLEEKFSQNFLLKAHLLMTGDAQLIQGGSDDFWGVDRNGNGSNHMGKLLMKVRDRILRDEGDLKILIKDNLERSGLGFVYDWIDESRITL